jgi:hypothetical protein
VSYVPHPDHVTWFTSTAGRINEIDPPDTGGLKRRTFETEREMTELLVAQPRLLGYGELQALMADPAGKGGVDFLAVGGGRRIVAELKKGAPPQGAVGEALANAVVYGGANPTRLAESRHFLGSADAASALDVTNVLVAVVGERFSPKTYCALALMRSRGIDAELVLIEQFAIPELRGAVYKTSRFLPQKTHHLSPKTFSAGSVINPKQAIDRISSGFQYFAPRQRLEQEPDHVCYI